MRRPQSASGLAAVTAGLFVATLTAMPVEAAKAPAPVTAVHAFSAAAACTPWDDEYTPPPTIRVLRTQRDLVPPEVVNTVQEVDFRTYVATTMAVEWPEQYPIATLKAGAVATKQFAWYHVIHPRGNEVVLPDGSKACYDVVDSTIDQYYYPERYGPGQPDGPGPKIAKAIDLTWDITVRKYSRRAQSSRFLLTGYRSGTETACGADANGFKLFHHSTRACGKDGLTFREILRRYLMPNLEIVSAGRHDVVGSKHGDATAMVLNDKGLQVAHVWSLGGPSASPSSRAGARIDAAELVGFDSGDISDDGKDDLVWLTRTGPGSGRISVALSDGVGYGVAQAWFEGHIGVPLNGARLMVGDFHADGRLDVAILARAETDGHARLLVLRKKTGNAFGPPGRWWSGPLNTKDLAGAWAGDVSGDGRADLIVRQGTGRRGVTIRTAVTRSPLPRGSERMGALRVGFSGALDPTRVRTVTGDANRDGREDVFLLVGRGGTATVERLQGQLYGGFKRVPVWVAPHSVGIVVEKTRLGAADIDYDGMTDLVLFSRHPRGTQIRVLKTRYSTMKVGTHEVEPFDWRSVRPY